MNICILNSCVLNSCVLNSCVLNSCIFNSCIFNSCIFNSWILNSSILTVVFSTVVFWTNPLTHFKQRYYKQFALSFIWFAQIEWNWVLIKYLPMQNNFVIKKLSQIFLILGRGIFKKICLSHSLFENTNRDILNVS